MDNIKRDHTEFDLNDEFETRMLHLLQCRKLKFKIKTEAIENDDGTYFGEDMLESTKNKLNLLNDLIEVFK